MDSRFTPFILTELPHRHARRTKIILGALFITACVLASLTIASKAAASIIAASHIETGHIETGHIETGHIETGHAKTDDVSTGQANKGQTKTNPAESGDGKGTDADAIDSGSTGALNSATIITKGISLFKAGKVGDAYAVLHPLAEAGNAGAQYLIGIIFAKAGTMLPDDVLQQASEAITAKADTKIRADHRTSNDAAQRDADRQAAMAALAHEYFKRAAQQGHIGAVFELAFQFERGIGTAPDMKRARLLYKVAARKNHLNAQYNLAILLAAGNGGKADFKQAYIWVLAAHSNALKTSHTVLTPQRVSKLAQKIRTKIRYHDAVKARRVAVHLTGFAA